MPEIEGKRNTEGTYKGEREVEKNENYLLLLYEHQREHTP
jgi:hypothetical protein